MRDLNHLSLYFGDGEYTTRFDRLDIFSKVQTHSRRANSFPLKISLHINSIPKELSEIVLQYIALLMNTAYCNRIPT